MPLVEYRQPEIPAIFRDIPPSCEVPETNDISFLELIELYNECHNAAEALRTRLRELVEYLSN